MAYRVSRFSVFVVQVYTKIFADLRNGTIINFNPVSITSNLGSIVLQQSKAPKRILFFVHVPSAYENRLQFFYKLN